MINRLPVFIFVLLVGLFAMPDFATAQPAKRRLIFLEIGAGERALVGTQQEWMKMLQEVGADRVRSVTSVGGRPSVEETETSLSIVVSVKGFVDGQKLILPGGKFRLRDKARIKTLLQKLRDDGADVALAEKKAFGLTSEQLVGLHQTFAGVVEIETKDQNAGDVAGKLIAQTGLQFQLDDAARAALSGDETIKDDLKGMSIGTSLAAIVRPLGLVVEPKREQGKTLKIHLLDSRSSEENWPIGWPIQDPPVTVAPQLFKKIPVEVQNIPIKSVIAALQRRAETPFFFDQNTMAREGIEFDEIKVNVSQGQITLMNALSKVLRQTKPKMSYEIRLDENGKPFLWISVR